MSSAARVVHSDPEILGGTPVFVGTRVPFRNLIDYLERNHSLDEFLDAFPTVSRDQVEGVDERGKVGQDRPRQRLRLPTALPAKLDHRRLPRGAHRE